jgi:hypothetical protein
VLTNVSLAVPPNEATWDNTHHYPYYNLSNICNCISGFWTWILHPLTLQCKLQLIKNTLRRNTPLQNLTTLLIHNWYYSVHYHIHQQRIIPIILANEATCDNKHHYLCHNLPNTRELHIWILHLNTSSTYSTTWTTTQKTHCVGTLTTHRTRKLGLCYFYATYEVYPNNTLNLVNNMILCYIE